LPRRDDFLEGFWVASQFGFGSVDPPTSEEDELPPARISEIIADARRFPIPIEHVKVEHSTWIAEAGKDNPVRGAVMVKRDRTGFRYERAIGLDDYVSQAEAAKLLQIPVMTIYRWVRGRGLPSKKRNGISVIKLRDVLGIAREQKKRIRIGGTILTAG
jgi:excisionase family DNA binding protein